jgi:cytochrome bd ubiquinol oxidase subunit II
MDLNTLWFILVTVLFTGFFVLEGFDYGVGMLLPFLTKKDEERRAMINSIGPVWNANEVWMVVAGGALFASFPHVYATLFSGFYLALVLMLVALILRGVGIEFRSKRSDKGWRNTWDWLIFTGSLLPALLWGVTVANLIRGFAIEQDMNYYGGLFPLLNPYAILGGLVFVSIFILHGTNYLVRKTSGNLMLHAKNSALKYWLVATILAAAFLIWTFLSTDLLTKPQINGLIPAILAVFALLLTGLLIRQGLTGWAFAAGSSAIVFVTIMVFMGLYPRILISSLNPEWSLTVYNAASGQYTLQVMTIVAAIFVPIVLAYQYWAYNLFRKRVETKHDKLIY